METKIQKWGNSLALRIPKELAKKSELYEGAEINIEIDKNSNLTLIKKKLSLKELLSSVTKDNLHSEISTGKTVGKEVY